MTEKILKNSSEKLQALRSAMQEQGIDGYLVPRADEWQGEYVPPRAARLAWLTDFTGSAGSAVILEREAAVYTDGRYELQIREQVEDSLYDRQVADHQEGSKNTLDTWILSHAAPNARIGYDPRLHTINQLKELQKELKKKNIELVPVDHNLIDAIWINQPPHPDAPVTIYPESIAGKSSAEKRDEVAKAVREAGACAVVITAPDSLAWLLNIRGDDVPHVPVTLSYAILHENGDVDWFVPGPNRITPEVARHLGGNVRVQDVRDMTLRLVDLAHDNAKSGKPVLLDFDRAAVWFKTIIEQASGKVLEKPDPCVALKACKTDSEQKSIIKTHIKDGVAMARFLKWVDEEAPKGVLTEKAVADRLLQFRQQDPDFLDTSFDTIPGWAANGAIIHYNGGKDAPVNPPGILLVDSGAQYEGGTTDITRTIAVGAPTQEMKNNFTRVLKGHIGIASLRFPEGVTGRDVEVLARQALWKANLDFKHGTGHGVGCYLSVHEAGTGIHVRANSAFKPGMFLSNEPGYYKENAYGIRIENLILTEADGKNEVTGTLMMRFNTVSLAPIDRRLIEPAMLTGEELDWLNEYHQRVYDELAPHLEDEVKDWLRAATAPVEKESPGTGPQLRPPQI